VLVQINGEQREFSVTSLRVSELVEQLSLAPQRIAIEVNREIVRRSDWEQREVSDGDRVEIVHFVGGGIQKAKRRRQ
jgi:thiamine biosynthesis protein ThiS